MVLWDTGGGLQFQFLNMKVVGKVVQRQLYRNMDHFNLWHGNLHSYRKSLSTLTRLPKYVTRLSKPSNDKEIAATIAVDKSTAFDSISHKILLDKLELYKVHKHTIEWIRDYLDLRSRFVMIGAQNSLIKSLKYGIPQVYILGPMIFNIYINDFPKIINNHDICQEEVHLGDSLFNMDCKICGNLAVYTDDAVYTTTNKDRAKNQERLTMMLLKMKTYLNNNMMTMNPTKMLLWELMNRQKVCKAKGAPPSLQCDLQ